MTGREMVDPKVVLSVGAAVLVVSTALAIYFAAAGCSPDSGSGSAVTTTSTAPAR
jgi:hypothetical protein